ncbi:AMP-dependent synthetase/ligase [Arcanobacterium haemolyticum]|uniref:Acyl-CoA synthetase n=1 Tax=Arcanobacterium haemolyticum (strain ATCC 9345 / DSM 20595 / CCM 5947 / CCUG 17215 / LMG 16163 / NBRC 15585 / NCTC 8452 / 11018) TaxID=644284 RepID=D7BMZ0_ARCHD|nr:long-chain fatty acid--CoA ligase [Arcanobacterium haemolyticum]ADH92289.1 AMP-dependent synthetase and ligase [Arcanobacterium haemolyticum DSM 20595]SQH28992.1 Long-chain-fatty-acid--CoA ligase FadD15 [Arcanobacterium haemolyticum]
MSKFIEDEGVAFIPGLVKISESMTVPGTIRRFGEERAKQVVIERKSNLGNNWVPVTWHQLIEEVRALARGFIAMGVKPGDCIAIMAHTSYEWTLFDFAIQFAGAHSIPIYETSSTSQAEWIVEDANIRFAVVENRGMYNVLSPVLAKFDHFEDIFVISEDAQGRISDRGSMADDHIIDERIDSLKADDLWTVIYTSGTTGRPKGAELTHRNVLHVAMNGPIDEGLTNVISYKGSRTLLFLPQAHVFARFINLVAMFANATVGYCDTKNLVADMQSFKPTFILAVPRIFEKIYNSADAKAGKGVKLRLFRTFAKVAIEYSRALGTPEGPSAKLSAQHRLGDKLVYSKLREITGGKLRYAISGGAPLGERLGSFFRGIGLTVLEGYGLTETSAPTTVNRSNAMRVGSVGPAYPGCYVKIAEDGEILIKGDHVFRGYRNNPEATKAAFTEDGWFRTGDIGRIDDDDFVWITGRKKELIVTAGGKNVAPAELEDRLRSHPIISQVVVVGDQKPFIGALVTLDAEALPQWLANHNLPSMTVADAVKDPQVFAAIDRAVKRVNEKVSRAESIRKFTILPTDFTVENGYLTPSLKLKRNVVLEAFAGKVREIYGE